MQLTKRLFIVHVDIQKLGCQIIYDTVEPPACQETLDTYLLESVQETFQEEIRVTKH